MSKTYTAATHMREARPRSKRLRALGSMPGTGVTAAVPTDVLRRSDADALYHPLRGRADLPLTLKDLTFAPAAEASPSAMLEVLIVDGVQYLHTRLPFVSDQSISAGGVGHGGQGGSGITGISVNGGTPVTPASGSTVVNLTDIASASGLAALSSSVASLSSTVAGKIDNPSGGSAGYYLRKTATGVEWAAGGGGGSDVSWGQSANHVIQLYVDNAPKTLCLDGYVYLSNVRSGASGDVRIATIRVAGNTYDLYAPGGGGGGGGSTVSWITQAHGIGLDVDGVEKTLALYTDVPTNVSELSNDSGFITSSVLSDYYTKTSVDSLLVGKAAANHNHDSDYHPLNGVNNQYLNASYITLHNGTHSVKLEVDSSGNLKINGNMYTTGFNSAGGSQ